MTKSPKYRQAGNPHLETGLGSAGKSGSGVPPLEKDLRQDASATVPAPKGRNISAQGKEHSDAALGNDSKSMSSPVGAKPYGDLPLGWTWKLLAEIAVEGAPILYGILQPGPDLAEGIPYVRPTEIVEDVIDFSSIRRTTSTIAAKYKRSVLKTDDVILSIVGTIGKVAIVPSSLEGGNITQSSVRIRPRLDLALPRYIAWALRSPILRKQFDEHRLGTAVPRLNVAHVRDLLVPVAPPAEQHRIVAEIEKQFTRLDAGVAALRRVQANLKRYRAAVLKAACEGRLVPTEVEMARATPVGPVPSPGVSPTVGRVPSHGVPMPAADAGSGDPAYRVDDLRAVGPVPSPGVPGKSKTAALGAATAKRSATFETGEALLARILTDRRQNWKGGGKYEEPAAPDTESLPVLPEGWVWARLEQLGLTFGGLTKNPKRAKFAKQLPYLRVANVYANELRLDEIEYIGVEDSELQKLLVRSGDLLIVEGNGSKDQIGRAAIWDGSIDPCVHQNHLIKVRCINGQMPKWVLHWMQSPNGRHYVELVASSTSGLYTLSVNKVGDLPVALPPLAEQTRIVAEVERRLSVVEELEAAVSANIQRAAHMRQSILQRAFTGELVKP